LSSFKHYGKIHIAHNLPFHHVKLKVQRHSVHWKCAPALQSGSRTFSSPPKETLYLSIALSSCPGNHKSAPSLCWFSYFEWNHTLCGLLCLADFTYIHDIACVSTSFAFYGWMILQPMDIWFIHPSVYGHFGLPFYYCG
jgi:hypothetical protein